MRFPYLMSWPIDILPDFQYVPLHGQERMGASSSSEELSSARQKLENQATDLVEKINVINKTVLPTAVPIQSA